MSRVCAPDAKLAVIVSRAQAQIDCVWAAYDHRSMVGFVLEEGPSVVAFVGTPQAIESSLRRYKPRLPESNFIELRDLFLEVLVRPCPSDVLRLVVVRDDGRMARAEYKPTGAAKLN